MSPGAASMKDIERATTISPTTATKATTKGTSGLRALGAADEGCCATIVVSATPQLGQNFALFLQDSPQFGQRNGAFGATAQLSMTDMGHPNEPLGAGKTFYDPSVRLRHDSLGQLLHRRGRGLRRSRGAYLRGALHQHGTHPRTTPRSRARATDHRHTPSRPHRLFAPARPRTVDP